MPSAQDDDIVGYEYIDSMMSNIHRVIKYSNLSYNEVLQLPCDIFKLMLKNSIVTELMQSEEGRAEIERYKLENTLTPDLEGLTKQFNVLNRRDNEC